MTRTAGTFTAIRTRDAIAIDRDGQAFIDANRVSEDPRDGEIFEIQFPNGEWILASEHDITWS